MSKIILVCVSFSRNMCILMCMKQKSYCYYQKQMNSGELRYRGFNLIPIIPLICHLKNRSRMMGLKHKASDCLCFCTINKETEKFLLYFFILLINSLCLQLHPVLLSLSKTIIYKFNVLMFAVNPFRNCIQSIKIWTINFAINSMVLLQNFKSKD